MKLKMLIAWSGAMIMAISVFNPGMAGPVLFLAGFALSAVFIVIPFVAMVVNPIVEKVLDSKLMNLAGDKGKYLFKLLFHVPTIKLRKNN